MSSWQSLAVGPHVIQWLPRSVAVSEDELRARLHPTEWAHAATLRSQPRRDEYVRSRWLVRELTGSRDPLPKTAAGAPTWPAGVVGSITHKAGAVGVCIDDAKVYASVGIDAEELARVHLGLATRIGTPAELERLEALASKSGESVLRLLALTFSFKESLFKSQHPLGNVMFYFHDAEIVALDVSERTLRARVGMDVSPCAPAGSEWGGNYTSVDSDGVEMVLTVCCAAR